MTQRVNPSKTNAGVGRKPHPTGTRSQIAGGKSYWHRGGREPAPGRGLQGADDLRGKRGRTRPEPVPLRSRREPQLRLRPARPALSADPALRSAADMCAAQMSPLAHVFRGTFVHSTWTCPMEVLRDHLLGVSDSGKVSGRGSGAPRRAAGQVEGTRRDAPRSPGFAPSRASPRPRS
jgi:hypothetical protein